MNKVLIIWNITFISIFFFYKNLVYKKSTNKCGIALFIHEDKIFKPMKQSIIFIWMMNITYKLQNRLVLINFRNICVYATSRFVRDIIVLIQYWKCSILYCYNAPLFIRNKIIFIGGIKEISFTGIFPPKDFFRKVLLIEMFLGYCDFVYTLTQVEPVWILVSF